MKILDSVKSALGVGASTAPPEDQLASEVGKFITENWTDLKSAYWMYHSWIWGALLMYAGELWIELSDKRVYQRTLPKDDFVPQPKLNKFAPAIDAIASNFQQIPEVEAVPTPLDDVEKIGISEVANELARHFIKDAGLRSDYKSQDDKVGIAGQLFVLAGCFVTNVYAEDEEIGREPVMEDGSALAMQCTACDTYQSNLAEVPQACPKCGNADIQTAEVPTQVPAMDPETGEPQTQAVIQKKISCRIDNALNLYPRPAATSMQNVGWFFIARRWSLDEIWQKWKIEAKADSEFPDGWNATNENALNFFYLGYSNTNLAGKDGAMVIEAYCEPGATRQFPDGFYAVYIGGECKHAEPWPFQEHPLTKADFKTIPTLFFSRSVAFDLVNVQREKCDFWSIFKLHALTTAVDPWIVDEDAQTSEITGRGDKVIKYRKLSPDTQAPHHAGHGALDDALYRLDDKIDKEFDNIGQTVSVFRGEQPGAVTAGNALQTLRSQAEFMFSGPVASWNNTWKETVRKGVKLMQKQFTRDQLIEIVGETKISEIEAFIRCDLDTAVEWIASRSGLPRTRDERRQELIELYDRGLLDVNDPEVKQKAFELFGETGLLTTFNKDATRARMENSLLRQGQPPIFMPEVDDNETHLAIHADAIKSSDFLRWPPEAQQAMLQHYLQTKQVIQAEAAAAAQAQAPAGNAPAGTPPATSKNPKGPSVP